MVVVIVVIVAGIVIVNVAGSVIVGAVFAGAAADKPGRARHRIATTADAGHGGTAP